MDSVARWTIGLTCACLASASAGCGSNHAETQASNLKPLAVLYGQFLGSHRGQPPAHEAEFKEFAQSQGQSGVDSLFISSRDKKPYVILYGALTGPPGLGGQPIFAYEQDGVDGSRFVANSLGAVEEVDEEQFRKMVPTAP